MDVWLGWLVWFSINSKEWDCWYLIETRSFAYKEGDWWKELCVSIIVLQLMSTLLSVGNGIAYMIQVLSLSWLMKKIWKGFNQQDVTKVPSGKVELWLCNGVKELAKIVITQFIDDLLKATLRKIKKTEPRKKFVGARKMS